MPHRADREQRWAERRDVAVPWAPSARRAVAVVPHPDDEVLMMGGLLARLARSATWLHVVAITDGEAAYGRDGRKQLARRREVEQRSALNEIGPTISWSRLRFPDGGIGAQRTALESRLRPFVRNADLVIAPWRGDHHGDHEACGEAAARLVAAHDRPALVEGIFWGWTRSDAPSTGLRRLELDPDEVTRRARALRHHRSQLDDPPQGRRAVLEGCTDPMTWTSEFYFVS